MDVWGYISNFSKKKSWSWGKAWRRMWYLQCDGETMNIWNISGIFYLCYDQSQQRSLDMRTSHKTINLQLTLLLAVQFSHAWFAFFLQHSNIPEYFWWSWFSRFDWIPMLARDFSLRREGRTPDNIFFHRTPTAPHLSLLLKSDHPSKKMWSPTLHILAGH